MTPTVGTIDATYKNIFFVVAASGGGTVTLQGGDVGQIVTIKCTMGPVTIPHSSNLILKSSVNYVMLGNNTLTLCRTSTTGWHEVGRMED